KAAGADRIMSVDLHAAQIQGFFDGPVDHLFAMPVLLEHFREKLDPETLTVVSPDMGRVRVADIWSDKLGAPLAIIHKRRDPLVPNQVSVHEIVGDVHGRVCLLVDDLIDTGRTIVKAAEALKANGAIGVVVAATHAVFSSPAVDILQNESIDSVVVTDTLPVPEAKRWARLTPPPSPPRATPGERAHRQGRGHRHAAGPRVQALGPPHRAAHRAAARARDPRGVRGRLGDEHVRRRGLGRRWRSRPRVPGWRATPRACRTTS